MNKGLEKLLQGNPALWRGREATYRAANGTKTGFAELDAALPCGGWPANALVEIVTPQWGIGELRLLLPTMAEFTRQRLWIIWVAPPYVPYAPALLNGGLDLNYNLVLTPEDAGNDVIWSMEKVLRAEACGMVLAWPQTLKNRSVRRLQLAAEVGNSLGILFRTTDIASPAAGRLRLKNVGETLEVDILKARGGSRCARVYLRL